MNMYSEKDEMSKHQDTSQRSYRLSCQNFQENLQQVDQSHMASKVTWTEQVHQGMQSRS